MEKSKKRGANYTYIEKQMFLKLVDEYKHIVENKMTNAECIQAKKNAWETIAKKYNAVSTTGSRNWKQLRHLYENLKQRKRRKIAYEKKKILKNPHNTLDTVEHMPILEIKPLVTTPYNDTSKYFDTTCSIEEDLMDEEELEIQPEIDFDMLDDEEDQSSKSKELLEKYYKIKMSNAALERKYLIQRKMCLEMQHKHKVMISKLKIQLLRKKLQRASMLNSTNDST